MSTPESVKHAVRRATELLRKEDYSGLAALTNGVRLSAEEIEGAVSTYGRELIELPEIGYAKLDVIAVAGRSPKTWSVEVPLWTQSEGRSDLTLSLTIIEDGPGNGFKLEIDDLHVL